jgi:hypothetical protein
MQIELQIQKAQTEPLPPCCAALAALANPRMESFAFSIILATGKLHENDFPVCRARHFSTISPSQNSDATKEQHFLFWHYHTNSSC